MFSSDLDAQRLLTACPRCGSTESQDNHLPHLSFEEAISKALTERHDGKSDQAVRTVVSWALVVAANSARPPFTCLYCREDFQ